MSDNPNVAVDAMLRKDAPLTSAFVPSKWLLIQNREFTLDFALEVTGANSAVEYYLEFTSDPTGGAPVFREIAQEDNGGGVVLMPAVVRTFGENAGTDLPAGTYYFDSEYIRRHRAVRVQIRVVGGGGSVRATITAPFGTAV